MKKKKKKLDPVNQTPKCKKTDLLTHSLALCEKEATCPGAPFALCEFILSSFCTEVCI